MIDLMRMRFLSFEGPEIDDGRTLRRMPGPLRDVLRVMNGFVAFHGAFHLRGACREPSWHALATVLDGELAVHRLFTHVRAGDIAFAQDALGDQFILRGHQVWRLWAETGELEDLEMDLEAFFEQLQADPVGLLDFDPLDAFRQQGGRLQPGELLQASPPFSSLQPGQPVELTALPVAERLGRLSVAARQAGLVPEVDVFGLLKQGGS